MKKNIIFALVVFLTGISNVYAINTDCADYYTGAFLETVDTDKYGCGPDYCTDEDGVKPYCVGEPLGATLDFSGGNSLSYPLSFDSPQVSFWYKNNGTNYNYFQFNIPVYSETIRKSTTIDSDISEGITKIYNSLTPMSFDFCTTNFFTLNASNFINMYFDGYEDLEITNINQEYMEWSGGLQCRRYFVRVKTRLLYLKDNDSPAYPMATTFYYYLSNNPDAIPALEYHTDATGGKGSIFNLQYYIFDDYIDKLHDISYRNYLYNVHDMQTAYNQSTSIYIADIKDQILNSSVGGAVSTGNSFFDNFSESNPGGISSVVTAPLKLFQSFDDTCKPLTLKVFDKNISLPCGTTLFWDKEEVEPFRVTWNLLFGGAIVYMLLRKVFKTIEKMRDPDSDKVEVMSL